MTKHLPLIVLTALALAGCGGSDKTSADKAAQTDNQKVLSIYNWSEYVDPETVAAFEKKHGIAVTYDVYDSDETLESKVLTGKSGYDIVGPSNAFVGRQIKAGAYQKIDKSLIPNYKNLNPQLMKLMEGVDPGHEYAVPFYWGTNTFAINTERVKKALGTDQLPDNQWDLVFNPEYTSKLKQCGISYLDSGDTCVTIGFGGDLNIAKRRAEEAGGKEKIRVMMPKEGVGIWVDSFVIPKDAKHVANAHAYINDFLDPEVAAKNGNFVTYAPSSKPAQELMDEEFRNDNTIFPTDEDLKNSFIMVPIQPAALKFMVRQWQSVKAGT